MRRGVAAVAGVILLSVLGTPAHAAALPPPPPPPGCTSCPGPPPPPTPVPTLAPTVVPQKVDVAVHLSPAHLHRGQLASLRITAQSGDRVTVSLRYHGERPQTTRARVGRQGVWLRRWRIPRDAPLGAGTVRVSVSDSGKVYTASVGFTVVK